MKKIVFLAVMALLFCAGIQAQDKPSKVPAYRGLIERVQPNGDTLRTYLRGDERQHWLMTEDGWEILENKKGWLVYAKFKKGISVTTCRKAHDAEKRGKCEKRWLEKYGIKKKV